MSTDGNLSTVALRRVVAWWTVKGTAVSKQLWLEIISVQRKSNRNEDLPSTRKSHSQRTRMENTFFHPAFDINILN